MRVSIHTLTEGAVILLPLLLVATQLVVHPATGLCAVHRQELHIYAYRAAFSLWDVEVLTVQFRTFRFGAEGYPSSTLAEPARVHTVHLPLGKLLPVVDTLGGNFEAFEHIAAVPWLAGGLAEWCSLLAGGAPGLVARAEVTGALGGHSGAAASRGSVALGQNRALRAGGHGQSRACDPDTLQLLCGLLALAAVDVGEVVVAALGLTHTALSCQVAPRKHAGWVGGAHKLLPVPVPVLMSTALCLAGPHAGFHVRVGEGAQAGVTSVTHTHGPRSVTARLQGAALILQPSLRAVRQNFTNSYIRERCSSRLADSRAG